MCKQLAKVNKNTQARLFQPIKHQQINNKSMIPISEQPYSSSITSFSSYTSSQLSYQSLTLSTELSSTDSDSNIDYQSTILIKRQWLRGYLSNVFLQRNNIQNQPQKGRPTMHFINSNSTYNQFSFPDQLSL